MVGAQGHGWMCACGSDIVTVCVWVCSIMNKTMSSSTELCHDFFMSNVVDLLGSTTVHTPLLSVISFWSSSLYQWYGLIISHPAHKKQATYYFCHVNRLKPWILVAFILILLCVWLVLLLVIGKAVIHILWFCFRCHYLGGRGNIW